MPQSTCHSLPHVRCLFLPNSRGRHVIMDRPGPQCIVVSGTVVSKGLGMPLEYSMFDLVPHMQEHARSFVGYTWINSRRVFRIRSTKAQICLTRMEYGMSTEYVCQTPWLYWVIRFHQTWHVGAVSWCKGSKPLSNGSPATTNYQPWNIRGPP